MSDDTLLEMVREIREDVRSVKKDVETVKVQHATAHSERMTLRRDVQDLKETKADRSDVKLVADAIATEKQDRAEDRKSLLKLGSIVATLISAAVAGCIAVVNWIFG